MPKLSLPLAITHMHTQPQPQACHHRKAVLLPSPLQPHNSMPHLLQRLHLRQHLLLTHTRVRQHLVISSLAARVIPG